MSSISGDQSLMNVVIKTILSTLLFMCLFQMPYVYFQVVRWLALAGFVLMAFENFRHHNRITAITYIALAVLFQPILKISLGRVLWNIVDVIIGIVLIISIFIHPANRSRTED